MSHSGLSHTMLATGTGNANVHDMYGFQNIAINMLS